MQREEFERAVYYFHEGTAEDAYRLLGAHVEEDEGEYRYTFRVYAPRADAVALVSDLFGWEEGRAMERIGDAGIFALSFSDECDFRGMPYKFAISTKKGRILKGDPYAFSSRGGGDGASVLTGLSDYPFKDSDYLAARYEKMTADDGALSIPINIFEVHLGSFLRRRDGSYLSYGELADILLAYAKYMGYTHIELLPIAEHPFDGSWGYQVCAYYAPTSRFGTPQEFCAFVDRLHAGGIGVILDWVPAHFPKDEWGLYEFDGAPLYEHEVEWRREARGWGTCYFDLSRREVQSFLISNALFWLKEYHIDGLRVDAVASMLYLDYDRKEGEWIPNADGSNRAEDAAAFFRALGIAVRRAVPDALLIAEESTDYHGITHKAEDGGLGFHLKWNMGFSNDLFAYLSTDPLLREKNHRALNFPITYAFSERYILPISHDEVVHGKGSFFEKMHGGEEEKLATFRAALLFFMTFPGKKLMFMGTEYGMHREWDHDASLDWPLLEDARHDALREYVAAVNRFYLSAPELYERDFSENGFSWLLADEAARDLVVYLRRAADGGELLIAVSFCGAENRDITVKVRNGRYLPVFCTHERDAAMEAVDTNADGELTFSLLPFGGVVFKRMNDTIEL